MYGPVRTVLWEDGGFSPLLPDLAHWKWQSLKPHDVAKGGLYVAVTI